MRSPVKAACSKQHMLPKANSAIVVAAGTGLSSEQLENSLREWRLRLAKHLGASRAPPAEKGGSERPRTPLRSMAERTRLGKGNDSASAETSSRAGPCSKESDAEWGSLLSWPILHSPRKTSWVGLLHSARAERTQHRGTAARNAGFSRQGRAAHKLGGSGSALKELGGLEAGDDCP